MELFSKVEGSGKKRWLVGSFERSITRVGFLDKSGVTPVELELEDFV
ncbi:hypothetical protein FACS1894200_13430 [Spirochaetia bacterium]|nr:hypothetical protein FACS1894200_13430 [Spirochaetia bacterium]